LIINYSGTRSVSFKALLTPSYNNALRISGNVSRNDKTSFAQPHGTMIAKVYWIIMQDACADGY
jgi:hypothetical protein